VTSPVGRGGGLGPAGVVQPVFHHPHDRRIGVAVPVAGWVDPAQVRPVSQRLVDREDGVGLGPPQQLGPGRGQRAPQISPEDTAVAQHQHPARKRPGQRRDQAQLAASGDPGHLGIQDRVRAALHQPDHPDLWERRAPLSAAAARPPERVVVGEGVGHLQTGPVDRHQPPGAIPRTRRGGRGQRHHCTLKQHTQRFDAQPGAGLGTRRGARDVPGRPGPPRPSRLRPGPTQPVDQTAHDLLVANPGKQRQRQRVVDHHPGWQQPTALLGPPGRGHDLIDQLWREGRGQRPQRDLVPDPDPG
jgi:hypothetical protein